MQGRKRIIKWIDSNRRQFYERNDQYGNKTSEAPKTGQPAQSVGGVNMIEG